MGLARDIQSTGCMGMGDTCFNLVVLVIVIYPNKRMGKIWIGDVVVSMSRATIIRAALILALWVAPKFMLEEGNITGFSTSALLALVRRRWTWSDTVSTRIVTTRRRQ
jgi:hypothetical protein